MTGYLLEIESVSVSFFVQSQRKWKESEIRRMMNMKVTRGQRLAKRDMPNDLCWQLIIVCIAGSFRVIVTLKESSILLHPRLE